MDSTPTPTPAAAADQTARDRLASDLKQLVDEADQLLQSAQRSGNGQFSATREKFEDQLRQARAQLDRLEQSAVDNARRAARATDLAVHEHPYSAMGIAAAAGVLIGMLIARR